MRHVTCSSGEGGLPKGFGSQSGNPLWNRPPRPRRDANISEIIMDKLRYGKPGTTLMRQVDNFQYCIINNVKKLNILLRFTYYVLYTYFFLGSLIYFCS